LNSKLETLNLLCPIPYALCPLQKTLFKLYPDSYRDKLETFAVGIPSGKLSLPSALCNLYSISHAAISKNSIFGKKKIK
jgi:hypothetical protein